MKELKELVKEYQIQKWNLKSLKTKVFNDLEKLEKQKIKEQYKEAKKGNYKKASKLGFEIQQILKQQQNILGH